jgi:hypothetical protein
MHRPGPSCPPVSLSFSQKDFCFVSILLFQQSSFLLGLEASPPRRIAANRRARHFSGLPACLI